MQIFTDYLRFTEYCIKSISIDSNANIFTQGTYFDNVCIQVT